MKQVEIPLTLDAKRQAFATSSSLAVVDKADPSHIYQMYQSQLQYVADAVAQVYGTNTFYMAAASALGPIVSATVSDGLKPLENRIAALEAKEAK